METTSAMKIVDAWNNVANKSAITEKHLAESTQKAGAAASTVGVGFEQFLGLTTAIGASTRKPGKEIGTALKPCPTCGSSQRNET
jgi:TP901 family phage tail tape measure protein